MKRLQVVTLIAVALSLLLLSINTHAVKAGRLWLPKKYQFAMVKLENTAYHAETSERCIEVIGGKIDHSKSSMDNFHFVITCRDSKRRSFNMVYNYPADAGQPELLVEQKRPEPEPEELLEEEEAIRISGDEAWALCLDILEKKSKNMIDVLYVDENPTPGLLDQDEYHYTIPLEAKNPSGSRLRYNGVCQSLADGTTTLSIKVRK